MPKQWTRWDAEIFRVIGMRLMNEIIIWYALLYSVTSTSGFTGSSVQAFFFFFHLSVFLVHPPLPQQFSLKYRK